MTHIRGIVPMHQAIASLSEGPRWHVLSVERTALAQRSLERAGVETWLPLCEVMRAYRPRGARHDVVVPWRGHLFPGYVLARFHPEIAGKVQRLDGVDYVLLVDGEPAALPDWWVEDLAAEIESHGGALKITDDGKRRDLSPPKKRGPLDAKGQRLRVVGGNFTGFEGLYVADAKGRVTLLLDMLGRTVRTVIPEALVIPA